MIFNPVVVATGGEITVVQQGMYWHDIFPEQYAVQLDEAADMIVGFISETGDSGGYLVSEANMFALGRGESIQINTTNGALISLAGDGTAISINTYGFMGQTLLYFALKS